MTTKTKKNVHRAIYEMRLKNLRKTYNQHQIQKLSYKKILKI